MPGVPTLEQVRAYVKVPATSISDEDLERMRVAVIGVQQSKCRWPETDPETTLPDALSQAILRGCQRQVAAKNLPLGVLGGDAGEFGPARIPFLDSVIEKLEGPYRRMVFG